MSASAILTDPEAGVSPACPCHERPPAGAAYGWHERTGPLPVIRARHGTRLDEDALADLDYLGRYGFEVTITAPGARHYPGHTLAVQIIAEVTA